MKCYKIRRKKDVKDTHTHTLDIMQMESILSDSINMCLPSLVALVAYVNRMNDPKWKQKKIYTTPKLQKKKKIAKYQILPSIFSHLKCDRAHARQQSTSLVTSAYRSGPFMRSIRLHWMAIVNRMVDDYSIIIHNSDANFRRSAFESIARVV